MSEKLRAIEGYRTLGCPICGETYTTHVDEVRVGARADGEDGPITLHQLDAQGTLTTPESVPIGAKIGEGRRHRIALVGWCEMGHRFAIVYTQHKGETYIENVDLGPTEQL